MSKNPFRTSRTQEAARRGLSGAFGSGASTLAARTYRTIPGELLPHYVSGRLHQFHPGLYHLDARLNNDKLTLESFTYDAATHVFSLYGTDLSMVPIGSRVEAGTPGALRAADGTRHANWVNVNAIYSHGDVISVNDDATITLKQAHGGPVRTLITDSAWTLNTTTGDVAGVERGDHVFFTGLAETAEYSCPRIHLVLLNQTSKARTVD